MEQRPKLKIQLTLMDKFIESVGLFALLFMWGFAIYSYLVLPATLPIHFGASGQPDGYGQKATIFILPVIGLFLFMMMSLINKYPYVFNYPVKITEANAAKHYTNGTRIIRFIKTAIIIIFTMMLLGTYLTTIRKSNGLGSWFLPFTLVLLFLPTIYFIIKSFRIKN